VPIRTNQGLAGLVAGMIQKSTVAKLLRQGLGEQVALLVSERGDLLLPEGADPGIEGWLRQQIEGRGASDFFAGAPESFPVQQWQAHWSAAKVVAAQKWWLLYLHPETDFQPQTLLAGTFGHFVLAGSLLGLGFASAFLVRSLAKRLDQQARHLRERRQLEREVQEVSEREQQRIGTSLHEDLCQRLTGIEAASRVLERRLEAASSSEAPIAAEITRELRTSLHSARQMADELQPVGLLEHGFVAALDELAAHTRQRAGIACTVQDQGFPGDLDAFVATHLFRIAQEAVANSLEHARADSILITLAVDSGHLTLTVSDNGVGIPEGAERVPGIGLRIMRYRAELIGAQFEIRQAGQRGTAICARFPYSAAGAKPAADSNNGDSI
jgi:signal transduction histidine kinase